MRLGLPFILFAANAAELLPDVNVEMQHANQIAKPTNKKSAEELFDAITQEIEERKQFLVDMEKLGQAAHVRA